MVRVSIQQKVVLYRSLATLLNSGIHLLDAFKSLQRQTREPELVAALERIELHLTRGQSLSHALSTQPNLFSPLVLALVRVGERTGKLHHVLQRVADLTEAQDRLLRKLQSALIYPAFVLAICLLLLIFAPIFVFNDLLALLSELKTDLPLATRAYLGFSRLMTSPLTYLIVVPLLGLGLWWLRELLRDPKRRLAAETLLLSTPALGPLLLSAEAAKMCHSMAVCYEAGLPILDTLKLSSESTGFSLIQEKAGPAREALMEGSGLAEALSHMEIFDPTVLGLLSSGEESGRVAEMLKGAARQKEEEASYAVDTFQKLLEPCLLLLVGLIVGFIAIATLAPTLKIVESL